MNERIRIILALLLKKPEIKMAELTKELNLTRRQINYAINQFNSDLKQKKLSEISRNHNGDFNIPLDVVNIITNEYKLDDFTLSQTDFSENERNVLLVTFLISNTSYVSLDHLTDILKVSKNTVSEDLKKVEWLVKKYDISLDYNRAIGFQLKGKEFRILQLLSDLVRQNKILKNERIKDSLAQDVTDKETLHLIHSMEQMLHLSYSDESIDYLQSIIRFTLQRSINKKTTDSPFFDEDIKSYPEYKFLKVLIQENSWFLSQSYVEWFALIFLSSNIFEKNTTQEYESDKTLKKLISSMVQKFENQTLINVDNRDSFELRILSHLRPACFRIKYGLSLGSYSLDSLIKDSNHAILNELMKELIVPIEDWLGKAFPYNELELLSYYFGYQLTSPRNNTLAKPRAVVVCANGVMVSKLMSENLKKLFPEIHFLSSLSVRDFYKFGKEYDLVFSTTPLKDFQVQFIIAPIMTYKEQISLRYRVLKKLGINDIDNSVDELVAIIQKYAPIINVDEMKDELSYFLLKEKNDSPLENLKILPPLTQYLKPDFIKIIEEELSWIDAIELACKPLLDHQIITEEFISDCKNQISRDDYTGYLGLRTCIPHTTIEHGVLKDGISLLISKKPIVFPNGQRINFIYPLSFYDLTRHLKAVNQLADMSNDQELLTLLLSKKDEKSIFQLIRQNT